MTEVSPAPVVGADSIAHLRAAHHDQGLVIDVHTNLSRWDGRRPDYHEIVGCLVARVHDEPVDSK